MKFVVYNLDPKSNVVSVSVYSIEDLLSYVPIFINSDVSKSTLYRVKEFAIHSGELVYLSKKYKFIVRKVVI